MKKVEWINKNKMKFESGFRTFDKQTLLITTGNALMDTQYSSYIRTYNETGNTNKFGKHDFKKGYLQDCDLSLFEELPNYIKDYIKALDKYVILYEFRHWYGTKKIVDGYVITDDAYNYITDFIIGPTEKSYLAIQEVKKYICN